MATPTANKEVKEAKEITTILDCLKAEDKSNFEWVSIPEKDHRGHVHPGVKLNDESFEGGKKYFVHPLLAASIKDRLEAYKEGVLRSLLSGQDRAAIKFFPGTN